jgi:hypothetical protein
MRTVISLAFIAALCAPAAAAPMTPLQRETAVWNDVKAKRMGAFAASMTPGFVGVYAWGSHNRADELRVVRNQTLRRFAISNFRSQMVDPDNMLTTYVADVRGTEDGESFSGRYWNTSLWHRAGRKWRTVYHGEVRAK